MSTITDGRLAELCAEVGRKMIGQETTIRHTLAAALAGGHVLLEDVPGTGKTTLAASLATVLNLSFKRIQGTPDLLPSELVGTMVFHPATAEFNFRGGPVFTQLLLMDEINRATPRTQSALLEAMAEGHVSVDGMTKRLPAPFFVIATANPIESQGVFPLPEAQLDRFMVRLKLGYISDALEFEMVRSIRLGEGAALQPLMSAAELMQLQQEVGSIRVSDDVLWYIIRLCRASRKHELVTLGASPRAVLSLTAFAQALAALSGREFVIPDDVQEAWIPVMNHRIHMRLEWNRTHGGDDTHRVLHEILTSVLVPTELASEV